MAVPGASGRASRTIRWAILTVIVGFVLTALTPVVGASPAVPPASHVASSAVPAPGASPAPAASPTPSGSGSVTNVSLGTLYKNHLLPHNSSTDCYWENFSSPPFFYDLEHYCQTGTQNPSILALSNGDLGLAYSMYTTNGTSCNATGGTNFTSWTAMNVGWATSTDNGTSWSPTHLIGSSSCRWPSSTSPTFAPGSNGLVYGAFVMSNETANVTPAATYVYPPPMRLIAPDWLDLTGDALGFVSSTDNGSTWSSVSAIPSITDAARPQIAVFGSTIYLVYINTTNGTGTQVVGQGVGTTAVSQMSVQFIRSTNGGSSWTAPVTLPGLNATYNYTASDPAISVGASGTIAVAYATNQTCVYACNSSVYYYGGPTWAYDIVVSTSTNNGSTWSAPVAVSSDPVGSYYEVGDYDDALHYGYEAPYMQLPQVSVGYTANGSGLYVVYSGTYQRSSTPLTYYSWEYAGVFASYSSNGGSTWTPSVISAPNGNDDNYDSMYLGAVGVHGQTAYATFLWSNDSYCPYGSTCSPFIGGYSQWVATSTNGLGWTLTPAGLSPMEDPYESDGVFQGWEASVAFTAAGHPVLASVLPGAESYQYSYPNSTTYEYSYRAYVNVSVATVYSGATTYAVVTQHNLTVGSSWTMDVDGNLFTTNRTSLNVSGLPIGVGVLLTVEPQTTTGYRTEWVSNLSLPGYFVFHGPEHADANFTKWFGVQFWLAPLVTEELEVEIDFGSTYYDVYDQCCGATGVAANPNFPWYFPANRSLTFTVYAEPPVSYWNGSGLGSYNGTGSELNLTLGGPVNETAWAGTFGYYNETFTAAGLPSTSTYSLDFAGAPVSAAGNAAATVSDVGTGAYTATNITATASQAGWEYYGWVAGSGRTDLVVVPDQPDVTLDFAEVNASSTAGPVEFHANGLGNGTVWSMSFNGTTYSSSSPYLNITTKAGTYPWSVGSVAVAANESVGYTPVSTGSTVSVTPGTPVTISYTPAYRVDVVAGVGGIVSSSGNHWVASGTAANYTADPSAGYEFAGWFGSGAGSYTGMGTNGTATVHALGAIVETASFYPLSSARFNLTFAESGIPAGVWWTVDLNGVGYSSNTTQLVIDSLLSCSAGTAGQYAVGVPIAFATGTLGTRYVVSGTVPPSLCTTGGTVATLTFQPQYQVVVSATAGGSAYVTDSNVETNASLWAETNDTVSLTALPDPGYVFGGWNGTGTGAYTGGSVSTVISVGAPVTEFATFVPIRTPPHPTYVETFLASPALPAGTSWSVTVNGTSYAAVGPSVAIAGLSPGAYSATVGGALSADGLTKWSPSQTTISVTVSQNGTTDVPFGRASYWVEVRATSGGTVAPASSWEPAGTSLSLNASANLGDTFVNWTGTGPGSYSGNLSGTTLTVSGPVTELATFAPQSIATSTTTGIWQAPSTWAVLGAVGLLAGLVVGIAIRRLRAAPAPSPPAAWTPPPSSSDPEGGRP
jgi:Divergent InlB B-repeat domain